MLSSSKVASSAPLSSSSTQQKQHQRILFRRIMKRSSLSDDIESQHDDDNHCHSKSKSSLSASLSSTKSLSPKPNHHNRQKQKRCCSINRLISQHAVLRSSRILFCLCLMLITIVIGYSSYYYLSLSEYNLALSQYNSIVERALYTSSDIINRKRLGISSMSSIIEIAFPYSSSWPYVALNGYEMIASNIISTITTHSATAHQEWIALCPLVKPDQIDSFVEFANNNKQENNKAEQTSNDNNNITTIVVTNSSLSSNTLTNENTSNSTSSSSSSRTSSYGFAVGYEYNHEPITPVYHHSTEKTQPVLLLNSHFAKDYTILMMSYLLRNIDNDIGQFISNFMSCSEQRHHHNPNNETESLSIYHNDCVSITNIIDLPSIPSPGSLILHPIYPYYNNTVLTGLITSSVLWEESLSNIFTADVSGIDCVLRTKDGVYTYHINNGNASYIGKGDTHNTKYDQYEQSICLTCRDDLLFNHNNNNDNLIPDNEYMMYVYPTESFFSIYSTYNPLLGTIGAVCIILFTSIIFLLYDYYVHREFQSKSDLLHSKRQFMRYVSHEVRTPLNSVSMGLTLLLEEIQVIYMQYQLNQQRNNEINCNINKVMTRPNHPQQPADISTSTSNLNSSSIPQVSTFPRRSVAIRRKSTNLSGNSHDDIMECDSKKLMDWLSLTTEVTDNLQAAADVLNDLLNYDKIESGILQLELSILSLWEILDRTAQEFKGAVTQKKIQYEVHITPKTTKETTNSATTIPSSSLLSSGPTNALVAIKDRSSCKRTSYTSSSVIEGPNLSATTMTREQVQSSKIINCCNGNKVVSIGDAVRLTQCFRNLISNALKFTPENGKITIEASWTSDDNNTMDTFSMKSGETVSCCSNGSFHMTVSDSGAGMTKDQLSRLFQDGVQFNVNELQRGNGTGLGLHITKDIIEQHNGTIQAMSDGLNQGTTFSIMLPLYQMQVDERKSIFAREATRSKRQIGISDLSEVESPLRILIVDNGNTNRKLVRRLLEKQGHTCEEAENDVVACDLVVDSMKESNHSYDTVLMDIDMPAISVLSSVRKMREYGCHSLIIGITGNVLSEDVADFMKCGASNVLSKPFIMGDLLIIWKNNGLLSRRDMKPMEAIEQNVVPKRAELTDKASLSETPSENAKTTLRVLIVDDAGTNRKLLRRLLEKHGHTCTEAENGEIAYNLVIDSMDETNQVYDTILMDNEMPVMNGPTSVKNMREYGCKSLIIGITGNVLPEDVAHFKQCGADNVLPKPFVFDDLMRLWAQNGLFR